MPKTYTPEEVAHWRTYLAEGMSYRKAAEVVGVDHKTLAKYVPGFGWTREQGRRWGNYMKHANEKLRGIGA